MHGAVGGENSRLARSERQSNQALARDCEGSLALGSDLHNAAFPRERGGDINIPLDIKRQALRTSEAAVEHRHGSVRVDFVDAVEARSAGAGDEHIAVGTEGDVIGGDTWLQRRKHKNLPVRSNLENSSAAVAAV